MFASARPPSDPSELSSAWTGYIAGDVKRVVISRQMKGVLYLASTEDNGEQDIHISELGQLCISILKSSRASAGSVFLSWSTADKECLLGLSNA